MQDSAILHADAHATLPAVTDLTAIEAQGLTAEFYLANDPAAAPNQVVDAVPVLSYSPAGGNPLPQSQGGGPIAGSWSGYLTAPQDGVYALRIAADPGAAITLKMAGAPVRCSRPGASGRTRTRSRWQRGPWSASR